MGGFPQSRNAAAASAAPSSLSVALGTFMAPDLRPGPRSWVGISVTHGTANIVTGLFGGMLFARWVAHLTDVVEIAHPDDNTRPYAVTGELFFASSNPGGHERPQRRAARRSQRTTGRRALTESAQVTWRP